MNRIEYLKYLICKLYSRNSLLSTSRFFMEKKTFCKLSKQEWNNLSSYRLLSINPNGPSRFRTQADNAEKQTCYFNIENNDIRKHIKSSNFKETEIHFQIE